MMSGLAAMTGTKEKPQRVGSSANDIMGGMFGVISILAALYQKRADGGAGADIRIGLFENCLFLVAQHMVQYEMTGDQAAVDAGAGACLADLRHFRNRKRRTHFHRRRHRRSLAELLPGVRPCGVSERSGAAHHHRPHPGPRKDHSARDRGRSSTGTRRSCRPSSMRSISVSRRSTARKICSAIRMCCARADW